MRSRLLRSLAILGVAGGAGLLALAAAVHAGLRLSLPALDGEIASPRLVKPVAIERDAAGVATLTGSSRADLAFALGFLHAQERFFQMDLLRRAAAGEVSELVGAAALELDRTRRMHRFRARARAIVAAFGPEERSLAETYAAGVNHGLAELKTAPFEYWLLRAEAEPWRPEDTILVAFAMYCDLQEESAWTERRRGLAFETLGPALARFLYPDGAAWDAPLDGSILKPPPIPGPDETRMRPVRALLQDMAPDEAPGSNAWTVMGRLTGSGAAMIANDMHLRLRVPNVWYRARLVLRGGEGLDATGVTLPGVPTVLAGSNGRVAWGFTNSHIDTGDVVILEPAEGGPGRYRTPGGPRTIETAEERICVRGEGCETLAVEETVWGPVIGRDRLGRRLAYRWVAHDPGAVRLAPAFDMERARTAQEALDIARRAGLPTQNVVVGDRDGHAGWTLAGPVPRRFGHDGRLPSSWADGSRGWSGMLAPQEVPVLLDPPNGRIWTANQRLVGGEALARLGFGGYAHGGRAAQIRDSLHARSRFEERDMLAIQLDERTPVFARWHDLMRAHAGRRRAEPAVGRIHAALAQPSDRAAIDSVSYRLVRTFRTELVRAVYGALTGPMRAAGRLTPWQAARLVPPEGEDAVFRLMSERPAHLLPEGFADWDAVVAAAFDRTAALAEQESGGDLSRFTWGAANRAEVRHPLSAALPLLPLLLDVPPDPLSGDLYTPRVATPSLGASERFAVTPGREEAGFFHMPAGQSGHPLSPYYLAGHPDWLRGKPTPFLPGPAAWRLVLAPFPQR